MKSGISSDQRRRKRREAKQAEVASEAQHREDVAKAIESDLPIPPPPLPPPKKPRGRPPKETPKHKSPKPYKSKSSKTFRTPSTHRESRATSRNDPTNQRLSNTILRYRPLQPAPDLSFILAKELNIIRVKSKCTTSEKSTSKHYGIVL
jgi:hypothetical protein